MIEILYYAVPALLIIIAYVVGKKIGEYSEKSKRSDIIKEERKKAVDKSRSVIKGKVSEELIPFEKDFSYNPSEMKFLGYPVDYIVFRGSDGKEIEEVVFLEIKTGQSRLSKQEKNLKQAIQEGNVSWDLYRR